MQPLFVQMCHSLSSLCPAAGAAKSVTRQLSRLSVVSMARWETPQALVEWEGGHDLHPEP